MNVCKRVPKLVQKPTPAQRPPQGNQRDQGASAVIKTSTASQTGSATKMVVKADVKAAKKEWEEADKDLNKAEADQISAARKFSKVVKEKTRERSLMSAEFNREFPIAKNSEVQFAKEMLTAETSKLQKIQQDRDQKYS